MEGWREGKEGRRNGWMEGWLDKQTNGWVEGWSEGGNEGWVGESEQFNGSILTL